MFKMELRLQLKRVKHYFHNKNYKSTNGVNVDNLHLLYIFPEEVWRLILENIKTSSAYYKICGASPFFQKQLSARRILVLFPDVAKILLKHCACSDLDQEIIARYGWDEDEYYQSTYLLCHLASTRLTCRSWKTGMDHALQNRSQLLQFPNELPKTYSLNCQFTFKLETCNKIEKFRTEFDSTHLTSATNPFPTRQLMLHIPDQPHQLKKFYNACLKLLRSYGEHVWYLSVDGPLMCCPEQIVFYKHLKQILILVPNLRALRLDIKRSTIGPSDAEKFASSYNCDVAFQPLKHLELIDHSGIHPTLLNALIKKHFNHLKKIGMRIYTLDDFEAMCKMIIPVNRIYLDVCDLKVELSTIFLALENKFKYTLTELHINCPRQEFCKLKGRLALPNLKKLYIRLQRKLKLDFLLDMQKSLEELQVKLSKAKVKGGKGTERKIEFYDHFEKLHESNIWDFFPKLKMLKSMYDENDVPWLCTREQWRKHMEGK